MSEQMTMNSVPLPVPVAAKPAAVPRRLKFCVDGEWRESTSGKYMPVYNPSIGEVMAETPCCTAEEIDEAVLAAHSAFTE